jgi:hypothetical protein
MAVVLLGPSMRLHHHFAGHPRVNRTEGRERPRLAGRQPELLVSVEHFGLKNYARDRRVLRTSTLHPQVRRGSAHPGHASQQAPAVDSVVVVVEQSCVGIFQGHIPPSLLNKLRSGFHRVELTETRFIPCKFILALRE